MFVVSLCGCVVSACVESCLRDGCGVSGLEGLPILGWRVNFRY